MAAENDPTTVALLITNGFTFLGLVVTQYFTYKRDRAAREELKKNTNVTEAVHGLVNGRMTRQLEKTVTLARYVAGMSGKPEDEESAVEAEKALAEHLAKMGR